MLDSGKSPFYTTEPFDASYFPADAQAPQPTQIEIEAFVVLLAQISRRLLADTPAVVAA